MLIHSIDREGRLTAVSDAWCEAMGYERSEVIGRKSIEFLTPSSLRYAVDEVLPSFMRKGKCSDVEYQFVRKDGRILDVVLNATSERDGDGNVVRSVAMLTLLTPLEALHDDPSEPPPPLPQAAADVQPSAGASLGTTGTATLEESTHGPTKRKRTAVAIQTQSTDWVGPSTSSELGVQPERNVRRRLSE